jgi:hypothetical protein
MKTFKTFLNESAATAAGRAGAAAAKNSKLKKAVLTLVGASALGDFFNVGDIISGIINKTAANMNRPGPGVEGSGFGSDRGFVSGLYANPIKITDVPTRLVHEVEI